MFQGIDPLVPKWVSRGAPQLQAGLPHISKTVSSIVDGSFQNIKVIKIAGKEILGMPLELIPVSNAQMMTFRLSGGVINLSPEEVKNLPVNTPMYWRETFEGREVAIDGTGYRDFALWKKIYEPLFQRWYPEYLHLTESEAGSLGLYPYIHERNHTARVWLAEMHDGHLATLDEHHYGELRDIYDAARAGVTDASISQQAILAGMAQALLGWRWRDADYDGLGHWVRLGSGSLYDDGNVRTKNSCYGLSANCDKTGTDNDRYWQGLAVSSVVVLGNISR